MPLSSETLVVATDDTLASILGDEVVLLELNEGVYFSLNDVGRRIWEIIQEPVRIESIIDRLVEEYEVDPTTLSADVLGVLTEMLDHGLVEIRPTSP